MTSKGNVHDKGTKKMTVHPCMHAWQLKFKRDLEFVDIDPQTRSIIILEKNHIFKTLIELDRDVLNCSLQS